MCVPARLAGVFVLGFAVALLATAQPPAQKPPAQKQEFRPAIAAILNLADNLDASDVAEHAKKIVTTHDSCDISQIFTPRRNNRGGPGIGSAVKAGHLDAISALVADWSGAKPPTHKELEAHQTDLLKVARVLQAMAELAPYRGPLVLPQGNKKKAEEWQAVSAQFKVVTRELRDAIQKSDATQTRKVAVRLQQTCTACHAVAGI
jgi:hypothetical protein